MAVATVGVLGTQIKPAATTVTSLYVCPATRRARIRILYANQNATTADEISVWISENSAVAADAQKVLHLESVAANTSGQTVTFLVSDLDTIRVESQNGDVSFTCNGYEDDKPT